VTFKKNSRRSNDKGIGGGGKNFSAGEGKAIPLEVGSKESGGGHEGGCRSRKKKEDSQK